MREDILFYVSLAGLALALAGWVWLTVRAWRHAWGWGLGILLFPPAGILYAGLRLQEVRAPAGLVLVGLLAAAGPIAANRLLPVDLGPRDVLVDGERHLTLTGWDRKDYGLLRDRTDVAVLQMANADVSDRTLGLLAGMDRLTELDLSNTGITDAGLAPLAALPALRRLRLANTAVTDAGFRANLAPSATLTELDLRGTGVARESVDAWRKGAPGRRALIDRPPSASQSGTAQPSAP